MSRENLWKKAKDLASYGKLGAAAFGAGYAGKRLHERILRDRFYDISKAAPETRVQLLEFLQANTQDLVREKKDYVGLYIGLDLMGRRLLQLTKTIKLQGRTLHIPNGEEAVDIGLEGQELVVALNRGDWRTHEMRWQLSPDPTSGLFDQMGYLHYSGTFRKFPPPGSFEDLIHMRDANKVISDAMIAGIEHTFPQEAPVAA